MSIFKRTDAYNLDCFGRVGYKDNVKTATQIWEHMFFMQASDFVINYLNKIKFFVALSTFCDTFCTLWGKNAILICLGEICILDYKVGKLIFFSGFCLNCILYQS